MKKRAVIFGAGSKTRLSIQEILSRYDVLCIADNDSSLHGRDICGVKIVAPGSIKDFDFDSVILSNMVASITDAWLDQLSAMGIGRDKIIFDYCVYNRDAREEFLKSFAKMVYDKGIKGSTAEAGVWKGDFAKRINEFFPDRNLYFFDTFEGFAERDAGSESSDIGSVMGKFSDTSESIVMEKMKHPDNCIIRRGIFPDTAEGINDSFCFVNLDMDLYQPTLSGLDFFSSRLENGGVIVIHDYFNDFFSGAKRAVDEWCGVHENFVCIPIGDGLSVAVTRSAERIA